MPAQRKIQKRPLRKRFVASSFRGAIGVILCLLSALLLSCEGETKNSAEPPAIKTKNYPEGYTGDKNLIVDWQYSFRDKAITVATAVQQTKDRGYIVSGLTVDPMGKNPDIYLLKADFRGDKQWAKTFGEVDKWEGATSVMQTADGGYIVCGRKSKPAPEHKLGDAYFFKTDAKGVVQWERIFGKEGNEEATCILQAKDQGYILTGISSSLNEGKDIFIYKVDARGNNPAGKIFGGPGDQVSAAMRQTSDNGYIIAGAASDRTPEMTDVYLIKTDAAGMKIWERSIGRPGPDRAEDVRQTKDGGYIVAGQTIDLRGNNSDVYLIKIKANGELQWERVFGDYNSDTAGAVQQTKDGGYLVAATSYGEKNKSIELIKTDASGNKEWQQSIPSQADIELIDLQQTSDGGYIAVATKGSFLGEKGYSFTYAEIFLIKLSPAK